MPTLPNDPIPPSDMDPRVDDPPPLPAPSRHDGQEEGDPAVDEPLAPGHPALESAHNDEGRVLRPALRLAWTWSLYCEDIE
ncbi:hypothetical protein MWN52_11575 [Pseudoxanthomonas winnipegensis]|uniref:hypothetical protein n=1 Tax=Pseudoxanthomonas winnipegensis TaxID=2480810 RepID=UPI002575EF4B|nr:hypothetical protein [Pseudoxanthomonas winnipegensis]WJI14285.1 hypothetical protein MWN52_11575 [Pseudoxanthomonas winnipegensis]